MPGYKNKFASPEYIEETILDPKGNRLGTIRIKPSGILWKPLGQHKYLSVPLDDFIAWITSPTAGAKKTAS
jgi:hypothetical protein